MSTKLAKIISRILDPIIEIPIIITFATLVAYLNGYRWRFFAALIFLDAILPGIYFFHLLKTKKISDWDISKRKERLSLFKFSVFVNSFGVIIAFLLSRQPLANILLSFWILGILFTIITHYYKISLHAGVNTTLAFFGVYLFGISFWWLFLLPVIVSIARIIYKKHSLSQVVLGALLPLTVLPILFKLFKIA